MEGSLGSWSVDPRGETITALTPKDEGYVGPGVSASGANASSAPLDGFTADVSAVFDAPRSGA